MISMAVFHPVSFRNIHLLTGKHPVFFYFYYSPLKPNLMAKNAKNIVIHGLTGKLGDLLVFRTRGSETIVAAKPQKREGEPSEAEKAHRQFFQEATIFAKSIKGDPELLAAYQEAGKKDGTSAYLVAVADFLRAPHIDEIDITGYHGEPNGTIRVRAIDDFKVAQVSVTIKTGDGTVVESGIAAPAPNGLDWIFGATQTNPSLNGTMIIVRVSDIPGHFTEKTETLS
jgi:hypothetical protein